MKLKLLLRLLLSIIAVLVLVTAANAAVNPGSNATLEFIEKFSNGVTGKMLSFARSLFIGLATLSLALGLGRSILGGEANVGSVAAHLAKWIIYVGVFMWIMSSPDSLTFLPKVIVNSFSEAGKSISGQEVAPDDLLISGLHIYGAMVQKGWEAGWGDFLGLVLIGIVILVVVAMLAGTMAVALIEMHLVICGGAILLGFGGFEYTKDIAFSYLKYSVSIGVKILMIMIIYALANELLLHWEVAFMALSDMSELLRFAGQILGGSVAILMAARMVPSMAQSVISGSALHAGHEMVTGTAAGMLGSVKSTEQMILGRKGMDGTRTGGLWGGLRGMRNAQTAAFREMSNTANAAKEGGIAAAVEYVGGKIPGVRGVMAAHQSGGASNAAGYVAASTLYGSDSEQAASRISQPAMTAPPRKSSSGTSSVASAIPVSSISGAINDADYSSPDKVAERLRNA